LFASLVEWLLVPSGGNPVGLTKMHFILLDSRLRGNDGKGGMNYRAKGVKFELFLQVLKLPYVSQFFFGFSSPM
jgi:hypothetical protein